MRLIDADELMEHVWRDRLDSRERIANLVKLQPTVTAEIDTGLYVDGFKDGYRQGRQDAQSYKVMCKDCKYKVLTRDDDYYSKDIVCDYWESDGLTENDFCSRAERREE